MEFRLAPLDSATARQWPGIGRIRPPGDRSLGAGVSGDQTIEVVPIATGLNINPA